MSVTRRIFPEGFKREAVDRVASSGLSVEKVATELGLHETVLRRSAMVEGAIRSSSATAENADEIGTPGPKLGFQAHPSHRQPG